MGTSVLASLSGRPLTLVSLWCAPSQRLRWGSNRGQWVLAKNRQWYENGTGSDDYRFSAISLWRHKVRWKCARDFIPTEPHYDLPADVIIIPFFQVHGTYYTDTQEILVRLLLQRTEVKTLVLNTLFTGVKGSTMNLRLLRSIQREQCHVVNDIKCHPLLKLCICLHVV